MLYVTAKEAKLQLIQNRFSGLLGQPILGYELAQMWCDDDQQWSDWMDLPLFLTVGDSTLSISWQKFDDLAIEVGRVLPFSLGGSTVRWQWEGVAVLDAILGATIAAVSLGRGQMSIGGSELEIWTRLLITLDSGITLDVFNALDANGIALVTLEPRDEVIQAVGLKPQ
ncbi:MULTISPECIES: hypothetical protein [Cyanophyceae]|uniref:Uncharacterized protein n=1 Tax=Leptolyngbya subtilissima DQ-A4 TaxID=2933933 RepID=A0ABV0K421_9CYAN|nr:hypothetical protein [Nodosilinea sp. FACHB-141]MBD2113451.1 hypothetical protein [Nodosilinea sp. FACHB-141]